MLRSGRNVLLAVLVCAVGAAGCAAPGPYGYGVQRARVNPGVYRVQPGDTLYSIAWRYDLDYRVLADWNRIRPPYTIFPGQVLRLRAPAGRTPAPRRGPIRRPAPAWRWPTAGPVVQAFRGGGPGRGGVEIRGRLGQPVYAAAAGRVVYSGSGLPGYGQLIIIKHNDNYLSAYGYNRRLLVREGQQVRAGQAIAEMGAVGRQGPMLYFEIRRDGWPVDPLRLLPRR